MKAGLTTSCGCLFREAIIKAHRTHGYASGGTNRPEYNIWKTMKRRCHAPKSSMFASYGGRGITVCDRWRFGENGKSGFECFIADMGDRPTDRHSIDRIDNDAGYSKGNCRWATYVENNGNRRDNTLVAWRGESVTLVSLCRDFGLPLRPIRARLKAGWDLERALSQSLQPASGPRK